MNNSHNRPDWILAPNPDRAPHLNTNGSAFQGYKFPGKLCQLWDQRRIMPPYDLFRWKDPAAAKYAGRAHFDDFRAFQCDHVAIDKKDVSAAIMATGKYAGVAFGLSVVWSLERAKPRLSRHTVIQEQGRPVWSFHFAKPDSFSTGYTRGRTGCRLKIRHQL